VKTIKKKNLITKKFCDTGNTECPYVIWIVGSGDCCSRFNKKLEWAIKRDRHPRLEKCKDSELTIYAEWVEQVKP
jgi:hypothetical protein